MLRMRMRTASAKASVAMARNTPRRCMVGRPRTTAAIAPTTMPMTMATSSPGTSPNSLGLGPRVTAVKAAREAKPAWPRLSCPATRTA
jgi:hypothetical protein